MAIFFLSNLVAQKYPSVPTFFARVRSKVSMMDQGVLSVKAQGGESYLQVETKWLLFRASLIYFAKLPDSAESPISKMNASIAPC